MSLRLVTAAAAACALSGACGKGVPADPDAGDLDSAGIDARPAPPLQITPETPRTADDLVALASGDITGYSFRWSRDGAVRADLTTNMVAAANTTKGEVWRVELVDEGGGVGAFDEVTIANTPPTSPVISVPSSIVAGGTIQCVIDVASTDDDGDTVIYTVAWTENGAPYPGATTTVLAGDTVPTADTQQSDVFVCTVTPSDGQDDGPPAVSAASSVTCPTPTATTFAFTGAMQTYTVPCGVTQLRIEAWGAQGGGSAGGAGGYVRGELAVTQGQTLNVFVGGRSGFNGGGTGLHNTDPPHGGGASDVRIGGTDLASRVIVAGGGGGGRAGGEGTFPGGAGGGGTCGAGYCGGAGGTGWNSNHGGAGGATGGAGTNCDHCGGAGGAGLQSGGGAACEQYYQPSTCGTSGVLGVGGNGGPVTNAVCLESYVGTSGGGGGYYGGGGSSVGFCGGGGGGGGSSWTGTLANPVLTGGARTGDGTIVLTPI